VAQAKARFSEVVDRALKQGPQAITRNGRPAVVVVSVEEWSRKSGRKGTLAEFFAASPLRGFTPRDRTRARGSARGRVVSRGWLIDTNIVSEWVEPRPDAGIVSWLDQADEDRIFLSVVSLAEIRFGVERLAPGHRRDR
jgi:prevent-host-death family protein